MVRSPRFVFDDGIYHILLRGNNRQKIFNDEYDYLRFLKLLAEVTKNYGFLIYHYCLMSNHVHMIVKVSDWKKLSVGMKSLCVRYVTYYRKKHGGIGHFFQDRFKSFLIGDDNYLLHGARYIELNPVVARIVKLPEQYRWSSAAYYLEGGTNHIITPSPAWEALANDLDQRRNAYAAFLDEKKTDRRRLERYFKIGFYGSEQQLKKLQKRGLKSKWSHSGAPRKKL